MDSWISLAEALNTIIMPARDGRYICIAKGLTVDIATNTLSEGLPSTTVRSRRRGSMPCDKPLK